MEDTKKWYQRYLKSKHWKEFKKEFFKKFGKICIKCDETKSIQVHHKTYKRVHCEEFTDVVALCRNCHLKIHGLKNSKSIIKLIVNPPYSRKLKRMKNKGIATTPLHTMG